VSLTNLQDMPWMCQNYEKGCREIRVDVEELEHHQGKCIFRQVFCPDWICEEKVMFKDVNDHLVTVHKNNRKWKMVVGEKNKWATFKPFKNSELDGSTRVTWSPRKITSTEGDVFYEVCYLANKACHFMIYLLGSPDEAKKFSCTFSVTNEDGEKIIYTGKIHTLDEKADDIIASESLFRIGKKFARDH